MNLSRREVLRSAAGLGGGFALFYVLPGCAVSSDAAESEAVDTSSSELVTCQPAVISANHGHALGVPPADVAAGVAKTYSIAGSSAHDHQVTVGRADFAKLAAGQSVTIASTSTFGHTHDVTVTCAVSAPATCSQGASATSISANHGHSLSIPKADAQGTASKTYSIKGASSHAHNVTLTAAHFAKLRTGAKVTITSTNALGHTHSVVVGCI